MQINKSFLKKVVLIIVGSIIIVGLNAYLSYIDMIAEKKIKTKNLVESTHGIIKYYHTKAKEGYTSVEEAKKEAINAIRYSRHGGSEYFWIQSNDKIPTMLMHATTPKLEGELLDGNGFNCVTHIQEKLYTPVIATEFASNLFVTISKIAKENGDGFIFYDWTKPDSRGHVSKQRYSKVSYFKEFKEWNWIVGSGIYIDDVKDGVLENLLFTLLIVAVSLLIWIKVRRK